MFGAPPPLQPNFDVFERKIRKRSCCVAAFQMIKSNEKFLCQIEKKPSGARARPEMKSVLLGMGWRQFKLFLLVKSKY
jgi:hypothetical protein